MDALIDPDIPERSSSIVGVSGSEGRWRPLPAEAGIELATRVSRDHGNFPRGIAAGSTGRGSGAGSGDSGLGNASPPVAIRCPAPDYPRTARQRKIEGSVLVSYKVRTDGTVGEIAVVESSGSTDLDNAATEALAKWRYTPAMKDGVALAKTLRLRFAFKLQ